MERSLGLMNFNIRTAAYDDAERLSRFYKSLSDESRHFFEPYEDTSTPALRSVIDRGLKGVDLHFLALDPAQEVFAHFFFMDIAREIPHLGIALREKYHGLGFGAVLITYLLSVGRHVIEKRTVGLTVMKTNERAVRLYKRMGFQVVREDITFRSPNDSYEMHCTFGRHATPSPQ